MNIPAAGTTVSQVRTEEHEKRQATHGRAAGETAAGKQTNPMRLICKLLKDYFYR
jgi:hypothetical protein